MDHICENGVCHLIKKDDDKKTPAPAADNEKKVIELSDDERTPCEVWTRVMGYHRPVSSWNKGKKSEFKERKYFAEKTALVSLDDKEKREDSA